jgi:hypothetical protein
MANTINIFDESVSWATFLATSVGGGDPGTWADVFETLKVDEVGYEALAADIAANNGQLLGNAVDDFVAWAHPAVCKVLLGSAAGGIKLDDLATPDDNTDLNASTTRHGLLRKLSNVSTEVLNGVGSWVTTAGIDTSAFHQSTAAEISGLTGVTAAALDDVVPANDTSNSNAVRKLTIAQILEAGHETMYELDWTAEANQTVSANGNVTVDGKTWTSANYASASLFSLTLGTGLRITSNSGSSLTWTTAAVTSPSLRIELDDLAAGLADMTRDLWVWSYFPAYNCPNSNNTIIAAVYAAATGNYTVQMLGGGFSHNGSAVYPYQQRGSTVSVNTAIATTFDVVVWRYHANGTHTCYAGNWAAGWPARSALTKVAVDVQPEGSAIVTGATVRRPNSQLIYTPATRSASGAPSFTLARTKLELGLAA